MKYIEYIGGVLIAIGFLSLLGVSYLIGDQSGSHRTYMMEKAMRPLRAQMAISKYKKTLVEKTCE